MKLIFLVTFILVVKNVFSEVSTLQPLPTTAPTTTATTAPTTTETTVPTTTRTTAPTTTQTTVRPTGTDLFQTNIVVTSVPRTSIPITRVPMTSLPPLKSTITPLSDNPILQSISPDVMRLIKQFYPEFLASPESIQTLDRNKASLFRMFDNKTMGDDCAIGEIYLKMLEDEFVRNQDDDVVTENRLKQVVKCKRDCNFDRLLGANYTSDKANFSKTFMPLVSSTVAPFCRNTLGKFIPGRNATNASAPLSLIEVLSSTGNGQIPLGSIFTPSEINNIPSGDVLGIVRTFGDNIDASSAKILATKLSANTSFNDAIPLARYARPEIFRNANPADLVANIDKFADKVDINQANVISNKIASNGTASEILSFLSKTGSSFADQIPLNLLISKGVNMSTLPEKSIPTSYRQSKAKEALAGDKTISNLDQTTLTTILSAVTRDDIAKLPKASKFNASYALLTAAASSSKFLTSSQRSSFLDGILEGWSDVNKTKAFDDLSTNEVETLAELFVAANSSVFSWLRGTNNFITVIEKNSKMSSTKCCSFLYQSRALYAMEAIKKLVPTPSGITATHLESLGPCFASLIPSEYLTALSNANFKTQISFFNTANFQPNISVYPEIGNKLNALYKNLSSDSEKLTYLSDIGSLIIYMNQSLISKTLVKSIASSVLYNVKNERDMTTESVQKCRLGSGSELETLALIITAKNTLVQSIFPTSSRKKRATTSLTCTNVNDAISAIELIPTTYFTDMDLTEYKSCIQVLGNVDTALTSDQCATFPKKIAISAIPDSDVSLYGQILSCYNSSDLGNLNITSIASIQSVGQVKTFTAEQKTKIVEALKKSGPIDASKFSVMGNLACGLTQSDLNNISNTDFQNNIKSLSLINDASCTALGMLYTKAKTAMNQTTVDSVLISEIGSVIAGISETDAKALDSRSIQALSSNSLKIMPANVVNSLSSVQIRAFSSDQLNALTNNPNSDSFSTTTKSLLTNAISNVDVTRADVVQTTVTTSNANTNKSFGCVLFSLLSLIYFIFN